MDKLKKFNPYKIVYPDPIIAKFTVNTHIDDQAYQRIVKDVWKADQSKKKIAAVGLVINSPGGSAVACDLMASRVMGFAKKHNVPYYTFAEDLAASAGYWMLCTGDTVYANQQSLVGSIGVITGTGALKGWLDKHKFERTHITTGKELHDYKLDLSRFTEVTDEQR